MDRATADSNFTSNKSDIESAQDSYYLSNDKYEQKLEGDVIGASEIHVYDGPDGKGYNVILKAIENDDDYLKNINYSHGGSSEEGLWQQIQEPLT